MSTIADRHKGGSGVPKERPRVEDPVALARSSEVERAAGHVASLELRGSLSLAASVEVQATQAKRGDDLLASQGQAAGRVVTQRHYTLAA
jgi:hypothetical protein